MPDPLYFEDFPLGGCIERRPVPSANDVDNDSFELIISEDYVKTFVYTRSASHPTMSYDANKHEWVPVRLKDAKNSCLIHGQ